MAFKDNLLKILKEHELTLIQLAKKSGVPKSTLHAWTTGQAAINLNQLKAVATALRLSVHELVFGSTDPFHTQDVDLEEIFSGDVHVVVKRIKSKKKSVES